MSVQDNCSLVGLEPTQVNTDEDTYDKVWKKSSSATVAVAGGIVKVTLLSLIVVWKVGNMTDRPYQVTSTIGSTDDCTAIFVVEYEGDAKDK